MQAENFGGATTISFGLKHKWVGQHSSDKDVFNLTKTDIIFSSKSESNFLDEYVKRCWDFIQKIY